MIALLAIVLLLPLQLWNGFALSVLWRWFAVPLGAPALSVVQAIGVQFIVSFLVAKREANTTEDDALVKNLCFSVVVPGLFLLLGWIWTLAL